MNVRKNVFAVPVALLFAAAAFSSCMSFEDALARSAADPHRAALGQRGGGNRETSSFAVGRDVAGPVNQYFFEVVMHAGRHHYIDTLVVTIDGGAITLRESTARRMRVPPTPMAGEFQEVVRFPVSAELVNRLLQCSSLTLQIAAQHTLPGAHQGPFTVNPIILSTMKQTIHNWRAN